MKKKNKTAAQPETTTAVATVEATPAPAPAPVAPAPAAAPKVPGVATNAKTRYYHAALIIKQHGHAAGITPGMVDELDAAYGKPNKVESEIALRNCWHALRAWQE
jgi:hypothetical protein